ncbi:MAG: hypothetical protein NWE92_06585 [Candidatus Bathyarchaeota archaeon]|nr:hypothetical protein [Candidatus Bathyarchaeota archaeon]
MNIRKKSKNLKDYCPQPPMPLTTRLKRHSLPIAAAVTALLVLSVTFSIFYLGLASFTSPPPIIGDSDVSFYESAYAKATSEQKIELDKIIADKSVGLPGEWRRPVLIAIGELPKDQPRLSAQQAAELFDSTASGNWFLEDAEVSELAGEFNKIAGAPDFVGGSGIERSIYFLNDERSEAIILMQNDVSHIVYNADGTQTRLPLGTQELPSPRPTTY